MAKGVKIGLRDLYYALLTDDPITGSPTYAAPVKVSGVISANINSNASMETLFAEDGPYEVGTTTGNISLALNLADIPLEVQSAWLGHTLSGGVLIRNKSDIPPWLAIGFRTLKSNGKYRYTWLSKGKFMIPEENNETKGDKINFQTPTINGNFVTRDCDGEWERHTDEDATTYVPATGTAWFSSVLPGTADLSALTYTVTPLDVAVSQAVSVNVVWTFNKALNTDTVNLSHFVLLTPAGVSVAGALTINAAKTVVTFDPTANLTAATKYTALVTDDVLDIWGCKPSVGTKATTFTTA